MKQSVAQYPPIQVEGQNPQYAKAILSNIGGTDSEMSAVAMYFYSHLVTKEFPEISKVFHQISIAEMRHLEIFGTMALQLGADPRLWAYAGRSKRYWSPRCLRYADKAHRVVTDALVSEHMTVAKYTKQAKRIGDANIVENLNRIIEDEKEHIQILTDLLHTV